VDGMDYYIQMRQLCTKTVGGVHFKFIIFLNLKNTKVRSSILSIINGESAHNRSMDRGVK